MTDVTDATSVDTEMAQETLPAAPAPPVPLLQGSFALYGHNGGYVIAWKKRGETQTKRLTIGSGILAMAAQATGMTPEQVINQLIGASE